ncbi:hypothetical protein MSG28_000885 [Choristoneura fumiferana]|uniref:Uncharacterized protein n=1 Tax=Choristoneura fumiferana TaxID=7141 RepID=A0ACC0K368_CHOFU|nr:hypothetical protein MSG28_000885 [Choristoneura fumiferana]
MVVAIRADLAQGPTTCKMKITTKIAGVMGVEAPVELGVPTGSVYGPVGYVMHVNSVSNIVKKCRMFMYADDMCLLYASKDISEAQNSVQEDFERIAKWAHDNGAHLRHAASQEAEKRRASLGHVPPARHRASDAFLDPHHAAMLFRDSRGLPVADPFLEKISLSDLGIAPSAGAGGGATAAMAGAVAAPHGVKFAALPGGRGGGTAARLAAYN